MDILKGIRIIGLSLYFNRTLVIADIHIGYEEALNNAGILVPRLQFRDIVEKIDDIFLSLKNKKIDRIIINGDLKHEFGTISGQEWRNVLKFIDLLKKHCNEVILIRGNHDKILGVIAGKRNIRLQDFFWDKTGNILICHGDNFPTDNVLNCASTIIIGHEHPAISLKEGARVEQVKCFLKGKFKGKDLIVQPSFNSIIEGTNVLKDEILSPFLRQKRNLGDFEVFVVEEEVFYFGKIRSLL